MSLQPYLDWITAHPWVVGLVVVYVVTNLAPRKHPDDATGVEKLLWLLLDRLSWLTSEAMPGRFKWLLAGSQRPERDADTDPPAPIDPERP